MRYLELPGRDPALNLALEEWLFLNAGENGDGLFLLWQNSPSIIIGRHQVTAEVVDEALAERLGVPIIRRISGGGAVYHDAGNLNFSFIETAQKNMRIDFRRYLEPVCAALAALGVSAEISGRNDLEIRGLKISGSGQLIRAGRVLHHGTLLFDANLEAMHSLLRVSGDKLRSRGIASQKARTGNLLALCPAPLTLADLENALISRCARGSALLPPEALAEAEALANRKYRTWAWNHGSSPAYDLEKRRRFAWGEVAIHLQTAGGVIRACRISGDFFSDRPIEELAKAFVGLQLSQKQLAQAFCACQWEDWFAGCDANAMRKFFLEELFS